MYIAVPNHDQALQQVVMLKKEVAELRAHQATTSTPGNANCSEFDG